MIGKLLIAAIIASHLTTPSYCSNAKLLDEEAGMWASRVWTGDYISDKQIKNSLSFLHNLDNIKDKYQKPQNFNKFYKESINTLQSLDDVTKGGFFKFSEICKNLYEQEEDNKSRARLYMLFERVAQKHLEQVRKAKSLMPNKQPHQSSSTIMNPDGFSDSTKFFSSFFSNTGKSGPLQIK